MFIDIRPGAIILDTLGNLPQAPGEGGWGVTLIGALIPLMSNAALSPTPLHTQPT